VAEGSICIQNLIKNKNRGEPDSRFPSVKNLDGQYLDGLLEAPCGPGAGFRLARPARYITVGDVLEALEGPDALDGCLLGLPTCGPENPCPLHVLWSEVKAQMDVSLSQATIGELQRLSPGKRHLLAAATA